jgi:hypothetical protein
MRLLNDDRAHRIGDNGWMARKAKSEPKTGPFYSKKRL